MADGQSTSPISPDIGGAARPGLCTDCGVSRMKNPKLCGKACQFIQPSYPEREAQIHGETIPKGAESDFFGPYHRMIRARLALPADDAQWTGITTRIAQRLLETEQVDAVLTIAPDPQDRWKPLPVIVTRAEDMALCRGMRMGFAPLLALLEPALEQGLTRLAVIGIPCQIHALRVLEQELGIEKLYVIGTPCSDNTTTEKFHRFLECLTDTPDAVSYLEFRADYRVEMRFDDGSQRTIPFLQLPLSDLPADFFPLTCQTCVDYTNRLADITVGYMGGSGDQWIIERTRRGVEMTALLGAELVTQPLEDRGNRTNAVKGFLANTERAAGGLPVRRMPKWVRPIVSWLQPRIGPKGIEFARARVEMKALETILHLRRQHPKRLKNMVPAHVWRLANRYGLNRQEME